MNIISLKINNFCGIASGEVFFDEKKNTICGSFGSGKSTFFKAFKWLAGIGNEFEPNIEGKKIPGIETSAEMQVKSNGVNTSFRRTAKQVWREEDGERRFDKYIYRYFVDGLEVKANGYSKKVLCTLECENETELYIFADPQYFNNGNDTKWNPEKRRNYLFNLLGIDTMTEFLSKTYPDFHELLFEKNMSQSDVKKLLKQKKNEVESERNQTVAWSEQLSKKIMELREIDFDAIESKISLSWERLRELQETGKEESTSKAIDETYRKIARLKQELIAKRAEQDKLLDEWRRKINELKQKKEALLYQIEACKKSRKSLDSEYEDLQIEKDLIESESFKEDSTCPVCGAPIPQSKIEESKKKFEGERSEKLSQNASRGQKNRLQLDETMLREEEYARRKNALEKEIEVLEAGKPNLELFEVETDNLRTLESEAQLLKGKGKNNANEEEISRLKKEIESCSQDLHKKEMLRECQDEMKKCREKVEELSARYSESVDAMDRFEKLSLSISTSAVDILNANFGGVGFSLFEEQGGSASKAYKDTCTATMNGIRYENLSSGQQILCDYLIGRALRKKTGKGIPMWVDEICRITNNVDVAESIFEFSRNGFQTIALLTTDAKLPVTYLAKEKENL